jgi:hypothetical protein
MRRMRVDTFNKKCVPRRSEEHPSIMAWRGRVNIPVKKYLARRGGNAYHELLVVVDTLSRRMT